MKKMNNKIAALTIALLFVLSAAASTTLTPKTGAHTPPWTNPTYAFLAVTPNPVQINHYCTIVMWLNTIPTTASGTGGDRWHGFTVSVTAPDGTKSTLGPYSTEQLGGTFATYLPTQVGNYSMVFSWPGQTLTNGTGEPNTINYEYVGDYFQGSTSNTVTLSVTQDPVASWTESPVPTNYWTFPIQVENRGWASVASNYLSASWLRNSHWQEYGTGPTSAHILWTKPVYPYGGIADARYGAVKVGTKDYETFLGGPNGGAQGPFQNGWPIILDGKIYYDAYEYPFYGYYCVDLKTGQTTWYKNGTDNGLNNPVTLAAGYGLGQVFPQPDFGQLYNYYGVNGAGVEPYLWIVQSGLPQTATSGGVMWYMLDAMTGNWILTLKNVPVPPNNGMAGAQVTDDQGDELIYSYNPNTGGFLCWNSSQSIPPLAPTGTNQQQWKPRTGAVIDAVNDTSWTVVGPSAPAGGIVTGVNDILPRSGYTLNVTGPTGLPHDFMDVLQTHGMAPQEIVLYSFPSNFYYLNGALTRTSSGLPSTKQYFQMAVLQITQTGPYSPFPNASATQNNNLGFSLNLLWNKTIPYPVTTGNMTFYIGGSPTTGGTGAGLNIKGQLIDYDDQVFVLWNQETQQYYGYSLTTGNLLWGPTAPTLPMDYYAYGGYQMDTPATYADGMLINGGYGGDLIAYNITTGQQLWTYNAASIGYESPYGANYPLLAATICNGIIYGVSGEHSATQPMWRGSVLRAINETNGALIWKLDYFPLGNNDRWLAIADGYIVAGNEYDGQLYCIGIGPSATTVSVPQMGIPWGSSITVTGTVLDVSAGTKNPSQQAVYPNGVPAVSENSEEALMEYLYEQQPMPTNMVGVPVTLTAIDPNGNNIALGTATSDSNGVYGLSVNTNKLGAGPGTYKIIAAFGGSNSYGPSSATSYFTVQAPTATAASPAVKPTQAPTPIIPSAPTTAPTFTIAPTPSPAVTPPTSATPAFTYIAIGAVVIFAIVAVAAVLVLRKRK